MAEGAADQEEEATAGAADGKGRGRAGQELFKFHLELAREVWLKLAEVFVFTFHFCVAVLNN